jgi:hypothetical protein
MQYSFHSFAWWQHLLLCLDAKVYLMSLAHTVSTIVQWRSHVRVIYCHVRSARPFDSRRCNLLATRLESGNTNDNISARRTSSSSSPNVKSKSKQPQPTGVMMDATDADASECCIDILVLKLVQCVSLLLSIIIYLSSRLRYRRLRALCW